MLSDAGRSASRLEQVARGGGRQRVGRGRKCGNPRFPRDIETRQIQRRGDAMLEKGDGAAGIVVRMRRGVFVVSGRFAVEMRVESRRDRQQSEREHYAGQHPRERALEAANGRWTVAARGHD